MSNVWATMPYVQLSHIMFVNCIDNRQNQLFSEMSLCDVMELPIFHFTRHTKLYNYADDNTISYSEVEGSILVDWFAANQMEANPGKFQGIAVVKKAHALKPTFNIQGADIECTDDVKLLGVPIDYRMNFDKHISNLGKKAARQINVLCGIGKYLPISCRKVIYFTATCPLPPLVNAP